MFQFDCVQSQLMCPSALPWKLLYGCPALAGVSCKSFRATPCRSILMGLLDVSKAMQCLNQCDLQHGFYQCGQVMCMARACRKVRSSEGITRFKRCNVKDAVFSASRPPTCRQCEMRHRISLAAAHRHPPHLISLNLAF